MTTNTPRHRLPSGTRITAVLIFFGVAAVAAYALSKSISSPLPGLPASQAASAAESPEPAASGPNRIIATVGNRKLTEADLSGIAGAERPVALDRLISQVVAAGLAEREFPDEAEAAAKRTRREVLASLYLQRKTQQVRSSVSEEQIKAFYDAELNADQFTTYRVSYVAAPDAASIDPIVNAITSGNAAAVESKFTALHTEREGYARASDLPMGIGQIVTAMKAGDYSRPVVMRNGVFIFKLDAVKPQPKPELKAVRASIVDLLVARKLDAALSAARRGEVIRIL